MSEDFNKNEVDGSKRTFTSLLEQLGEDADQIWALIDHVCSKTIHSLKPFMQNFADEIFDWKTEENM
jgi:hypothetical protein